MRGRVVFGFGFGIGLGFGFGLGLGLRPARGRGRGRGPCPTASAGLLKAVKSRSSISRETPTPVSDTVRRTRPG